MDIKDYKIKINETDLAVRKLCVASNPNCPSLIFLHDALGSIAGWRDFPEAVVEATGLTGYVYDRQGHGKSSPFTQNRTLHYLHDEAFKVLPQVVKELGLRDIILIGHSDGGSIALLFTSQKNQAIKVRGLVTESAHVFVEEETLIGINAAVSLAESSDFLKKLSRFHGEKTQAVFEAWHKTWLMPEFRGWNIESYLPAIKAPLLIIQGENDEYGTLKQVESIVKNVAGPVQKIIPQNCAHVPHYQASGDVLKALTQFIESLF